MIGVKDPDEYRRRRAELLDKLVLTDPHINILQNHPKEQYPFLVQTLEILLRQRVEAGKLVLPNLSAFSNQSLGIFSDYSGEGSGNWMTYSILVCGYGYTSVFADKVNHVRQKYSLRDKEIAFKDFGYGPLRAALPDYLAAASELPGFLCTVAVDKRITTLFGAPDDKTALKRLAQLLADHGVGHWKARESEKLLRVIHMSAYLVALLGADGQKIFWMTDNDAICSNEVQHNGMLGVFDNVLRIYTRPGIDFPLIGGALPFGERSIMMNDLLSLPDVVAGSVAQYLTKLDSEAPATITLKDGANDVFAFLATDGPALRKATFVITLDAEGKLATGPMDIALRLPSGAV